MADLFIPKDAEDLLRRWLMRARMSQNSHYRAAIRLEREGRLLGVPAAVLSTIVGTTVFAALQKSIEIRIQIAIGLISVLAAVLTALQTFLAPGEKAARHRSAAARYGAIRRRIELLLASGVSSSDSGIERIREILDSVAESAPEIPQSVWSQEEIRAVTNDQGATT